MNLQWPHVTVTGLPSGLSASPIVIAIELLLFAYFVVVNAIDFALIVVAMRRLPAFIKLGRADTLRSATLPYATPVSIILPAYNEEEHILAVVTSLSNIKYPNYEIIVVNDGSKDATLKILQDAYDLVPVPQAQYVRFQTKAIRTLYRSRKLPNLRVLDKENGGKGDALNAGLNESRYPLFLAADGDSIYTPDVLEQMIQPFLQDSATVGCGAGLRILNGADRSGPIPVQRKLPRSLLVRFQIVEYLRAGLTSRFGWAPLNGIMCISGACALWKKDVVIDAGGYATSTIWEDAEMTVRVHHYMRASRRRYAIAFVPAGVCWTTVPETLSELGNQRVSWHRHISEAISRHRNMLFRPRAGLIGSFALPAYVFNEWLAPLWLLVGLGFLTVAGILGILSWQAQLALLTMVFALTVLKMSMAFLLDEVSYRTYGMHDVWALFVAAMLEQFGYRQLQAVWNLKGMLQFYLKRPIRGNTEGIAGPSDPPYQPVTPVRQST
jgi:cellulose synthase/poly-beta-1,6-N-acetylglucosamine synthase-like glycosyltransferase